MTTTANIRDQALGFQGGAGIEYKVSNRMALFAEGTGRLVKLSNWEGSETESAPYDTDKSGPL